MTDNQQPAARTLADAFGWQGRELHAVLQVVQPLIDAAEARGRSEMVAKVEKLANEYHAEGRRRVAFAEPAWPLDVARRLRALVAEVTAEEAP